MIRAKARSVVNLSAQRGRSPQAGPNQLLIQRTWGARPRWLAVATALCLCVVACGGQPAGSPVTVGQSASPSPGLPHGTIVIQLPKTTKSDFAGAFELRSTASRVWISDGLFSIDPATNAVSAGLDTSHIGYDAPYIATDGTSVWGADYTQSSVRRYDTTTGRLIATIPISTAEGIVYDFGSTWVVSHHDGHLYRIDPSTNRVSGSVQVSEAGRDGLQGITSGLGSVWVGGGVTQSISQVDPVTMKVIAQVVMPGDIESCGDLAVSTHDVWTTECLDSSHVVRLDPATQAVRTYNAQGVVTTLSADGTSVWFVTGDDPTSSAPRPAALIQLGEDMTVRHRVPLGNGVTTGGSLIAFGSLWLFPLNKDEVLRIPLSAIGG